MNLLKWIFAYWKGYKYSFAFHEAIYTVHFKYGKSTITKEKPELRGLKMGVIFYDESGDFEDAGKAGKP